MSGGKNQAKGEDMRRPLLWGFLLGATLIAGGCKSSSMSGHGGGAPDAPPNKEAPTGPDTPDKKNMVVDTPETKDTKTVTTPPANWCQLRIFAAAVRKGETCDAFATRVKAAGILFIPGLTTLTVDDYAKLSNFPADPANPVKVIVVGSAQPPADFVAPDGMTMETNATVSANLKPIYTLFLDLLSPPASERRVQIKGNGNTEDQFTSKLEFSAPKRADEQVPVVQGDEVVITLRYFDIISGHTAGVTNGILGADSIYWACKIASNGTASVEQDGSTVKSGGFKALIQTAGTLQQAFTQQNEGGFISVSSKLDKVDEAQQILNGGPKEVVDKKVAPALCTMFSFIWETSRQPSSSGL